MGHPAFVAGRERRSGVFGGLLRWLAWMPQAGRGVLLISFAVGIADQLKLHSPRGEKINPCLSCIWAGSSDCALAQKTHSFRRQVGDRRIEVVDIEGEMMSPDVAVFRLSGIVIGRLVLENLEVRSILTTKETQPAHHRSGVHI